MSYQFCKEDLFDFAKTLGYETKIKGDELFFKRCPYCNGGTSDYWTFSVNMISGAFKCFRASCGHDGHFVELCRDMDYRLDYEAPKIYKKLPQKPIKIRDAAVQYMKSRGISEAVTKRFCITTSSTDPNVIVFPFYDETNKLVAVKYRKANFDKTRDKNKEWFEKDTEPILFGMNQCKGFDRLIITEGQIDSLSVIEAGYENAVSVPTGANGFTWLKNVWGWIIKFREIVVFGDCEHGKITLLDQLMARLPKDIIVRAVRIEDYLHEKDANDILRKFGPRSVRRCIDGAEIPKLDNVKQLADVQSVDINKVDKIMTGIDGVDKVIKGMAMGQLVILTGKRGEGKSTLMSQIVAEALDQNRTVFVYSGELADFHFKRWLDYQLAGSHNIEESTDRWGQPEYSLKDDVVGVISSWYRNRAYIYDNAVSYGSKERETLPDTIEKVILQYNAQLICVDNLMTSMEQVTEQSNLYLAQSNFVGRLKELATKYQVVILLVAHPKKGGINDTQDENDLVAGSSDITNKADIVLKYSRAADDADCDGLIKVTKNRIMGTLLTRNDNAVRTRYDRKSKRITDIDSQDARYEKLYGWEKLLPDVAETIETDTLPF